MIFDVTFLIIFTEYYWNKVHGWDMELALRRFVIILSYVKFGVKCVFLPLLWKICIDFEETVRYKESEFYNNKLRK